MSLSNNMAYSNGGSSGHSSNFGAGLSDQGPFIKEWQEGLRALLPNANISMGNGAVPTNNSSNSRYPPGMANNHPQMHQQQHHHHQQHQQQQSAATKGWRGNASDWTSLDPAIVSSGQITDSRSDSPPHWLRSLEQLTESSPAQQQQQQQQQQPPTNSSNIFGLAGSTHATHYSLPSMASRGNNLTPGLDGLNSMAGSFWPPSVSHTTPSMPPPGFSHIRPSPKTATAADTQKITDSKSSVYHGISKLR